MAVLLFGILLLLDKRHTRAGVLHIGYGPPQLGVNTSP